MINKVNKNSERVKRHNRIRNRISGTAEKPRFSVYRSEKHIYIQLIDDVKGVTLASASDVEKSIIEAVKDMTKSEAAKYVGKVAGERAIAAGIKEIVFDRGGYLYIGRVQKVAEGAREAGLQF